MGWVYNKPWRRNGHRKWNKISGPRDTHLTSRIRETRGLCVGTTTSQHWQQRQPRVLLHFKHFLVYWLGTTSIKKTKSRKKNFIHLFRDFGLFSLLILNFHHSNFKAWDVIFYFKIYDSRFKIYYCNYKKNVFILNLYLKY